MGDYMRLQDFPRPPNDNGRGVHWSLSVYEWGMKNWAYWAELLSEMNIKWVKIMDDGGGSGLRLAQRLVDMEIMPVVRFYWPEQNPGNIGSRGMGAVEEYIKLGTVYFETNNEPDLDLEWKNGRKPENWLDVVMANYAGDADKILEAGGYPAVPAFGVGTLRDPFKKLMDMGRRDILDGGAWAAIHNYCLGRPLEYPNDPVNVQGVPITEDDWEVLGGMWAWEMGYETVNQHRLELANPDANVMEDATCFRAFEQVNAHVVAACGHSIPVMTTEGGYNVGQRAGTTVGDDPRYPKPTPHWDSVLNRRMFEFMQGDIALLGSTVPEYYFACMPWLIAAYSIGVWAAPAENQGPWITSKYDEEWNLNGELPLVQMLRDLPSPVRAHGPFPVGWCTPVASDILGRRWDNRLDYIGVKYVPIHTEVGVPCWRVASAKWFAEWESGGRCAIYIKALDEDGQGVGGLPISISREDGAITDTVVTKGAVDGYWADYAMYGGLGTYTVSIPGCSDAVVGLGYGVEEPPHAPNRTAFELVFQRVPAGDSPPEEPEPPAPEPPTPIPPVPPESSTAKLIKILAAARAYHTEAKIWQERLKCDIIEALGR